MNRKRLLVPALVAIGLLAGAVEMRAQDAPAEDLEAIRRTALDYIEGWYEGDGEKMARALHPDLAKRMVSGKDGQSQLNLLDKQKLVDAARSGRGKSTPLAEQRKDVKILEVFGKTATVRLDARDWVDFLHIVQWNGRWVIINVLWEPRP